MGRRYPDCKVEGASSIWAITVKARTDEMMAEAKATKISTAREWNLGFDLRTGASNFSCERAESVSLAMKFKIFSKPFTIVSRTFNELAMNEVMVLVMVDRIFAKSVIAAFMIALATFLSEVTIARVRFTVKNKAPKKKATIETKIFCKPITIEVIAFLTADMTFAKKVVTEDAIFSKNALEA